ncbi:MAG: hypothetical protein KF687_01435 [Cyclobacteriaceae bacterium]|nr:hypothetical protein [Cyclobacteriaceae bacterium]
MAMCENMSDLEFAESFAAGALNPSDFDHKAHLRLAWIHISQYGVEKAIAAICDQIRAFAAANGAKDKYNKTVTVAAIRAVYHFMLRSNTTDFESFIQENPRLMYNFKELLNHHYSTNIFTSALAKREYLQPELLPFD